MSVLDGICEIPALVARAKQYGMDSLAITDHGNMLGIVEFYTECRKQGIKPILGAEVYVTVDRTIKDRARLDMLAATDPEYAPYARSTVHKQTVTLKGPDGTKVKEVRYKDVITWNQGCHLLLLAATNEGYENLIKVVTDANLNGFYYRPLTDMSVLSQYGKGIIATSACLAGPISRLILAGKTSEAVALARRFSAMFDAFYLELQPSTLSEQLAVNAALIQISRDTGIPLVCTSDVHYIDQEDCHFHDVVLAMQTNSLVDAPDRLRFPDNVYFLHTEQQMLDAGMPVEAVRNTACIADACNVTIDLGVLHPPIATDLPGGTTPEAHLKSLALRNMYAKIEAEDLDFDLYMSRLKYELGVICDKKLASYFLIVKDYVDVAKSRGILVGPGRGSAAGALVSYALGITDMDPIKYGLLFERFLNPERVMYPDIDIDFDRNRRGELLQYLAEHYGADRVCTIGTISTLTAKAALRRVGKSLGVPNEAIDFISKCIPSDAGKLRTLHECLHGNPDKGLDPIPELVRAMEEYPNWISIAEKVEFFPANVSSHASGVVISPEPLSKYCPLMLDRDEQVVVSQFDMDAIEQLGLIKVDILALKTLSIIADTLRMLKARGIELDYYAIGKSDDFSDPRVYELLSKGDTSGVFQVESDGMRRILSSVCPTNLAAIAAINALYRPGPLDLVPSYIARSRGYTPVTYDDPRLEPILRETYGVIVYQEQVMEIAKQLAGFTPGEADALRKGVGKKKRSILLAELDKLVYGTNPTDPNEHAIPGLIRMGMSEDVAKKISSQLETFADYAFNKSHAYCYSKLTYQTAWLKAYYRPEYMAAFMTAHITGERALLIAYLDECRRDGMAILPPDLNKSEIGFSVEDGNIRVGLSFIMGLGDGNLVSLLAKRPFTSIEHLAASTLKSELNRKVIVALVYAGALDTLPRERSCANRFELLNYLLELRGLPLEPGPVTAADILDKEYELLGTYLTLSPLADYDTDVRLSDIPERTSFTVPCFVLEHRTVTTKKGELMSFVDVEMSRNGRVTLTIFPKDYAKLHRKVRSKTVKLFTITRLSRPGYSDTLVVEDINNPTSV